MTCYSGSCNDGNLVGRLVFTSQNRIKHMGIQTRAKEMPTQSGGVWQEMWCTNVAMWRSSCNQTLEIFLVYFTIEVTLGFSIC